MHLKLLLIIFCLFSSEIYANLVQENEVSSGYSLSSTKILEKHYASCGGTSRVNIGEFKPSGVECTYKDSDNNTHTTYIAKLPSKIEQNLILQDGTLDLQGTTLVIEGDFIQAGGTVALNGGSLIVKGDYRIQKPTDEVGLYTYSFGELLMQSDDESVLVYGDFVNDSTINSSNNLIAGTLEVKGHFNQLSTYSRASGNYSFKTSGTHKVILSGTEQQTVYFDNPGNSYSLFNQLLIENSSSAGVDFKTKAYVSSILYKTSTPIHNSENLTLSGQAIIEGGVWESDLSIDTYSSSWVLSRDQLIKGNFYIAGAGVNLTDFKLTVEGDLIHSDGNLNINKGSLIVKGNYRVQKPVNAVLGEYTYSSGILLMQDVNASVLVYGSFTMDSREGSRDGLYLSAGTLEVKGDFTQLSSYSGVYNFKASGTHKVILSGDKQQTVHFDDTYNNSSLFSQLEIKNTSLEGVNFDTLIAVSSVLFNTTTPIVNSKNIALVGSAIINGGVWNNDITISNNDTTWLLSADQTINGNFYVNGSEVNLNGFALTVEGNLIQSDGALNIAQGSLVVKGDYRLQKLTAIPGEYTYSNGSLLMKNDSDRVLVNGDFVTDARSSSNNSNLSAGILEIKGDFSQLSTNSGQYNFRATGTHKVILSGNEQQIVHFDDPSYKYSQFNQLEIANNSDAGVVFESEALVGSALLPTTSAITHSENIVLSGPAVIDGGVWGGNITVNANSSAWVLNADQTIKGNLYLSGSDINLNGFTLTVEGQITQAGGELTVAEGHLIVKGDYRIQKPTDIPSEYVASSGALVMKTTEDSVLVGGDFITFSNPSNSYNKDLVAGTLEVKGDFISLGRYSFIASGTHKVVLSGTELQKISLERTKYNESVLNELLVTNTSVLGINVQTDVLVASKLYSTTTPIINSENIVLSGQAVIEGNTWPNNLTVNTSSSPWVLTNDQVIKGNLFVSGSEVNLNGKKLTVEGNLVHSDGEMDIAQGSLVVNGDYLIQKPTDVPGEYTYSSGILLMQNAEDSVFVGGNFVMDSYKGAQDGSYLSAGTLELKGDFTQLSTSSGYYNFRASGTHKVILSGNTPQSVHFDDPKSNFSQFNQLQITNSSMQGINFETATLIAATLYSTNTPISNSSNIVLTGRAVVDGGIWRHNLTINDDSSPWFLSNDLVIQGNLNITGSEVSLNTHTLTVKGSLIHSDGDLNINQGALIIEADYRIQTPDNIVGEYKGSSGVLLMQSTEDRVLVNGNFYIHSNYNVSNDSDLSAGILEVKGDFMSLGSYSFKTSGTHKVTLSGSKHQTVHFDATKFDSSRFNELLITNSSESSVSFDAPAIVSSKLYATTTAVINSENIVLSGQAVIEGNTWPYNLSVNSNSNAWVLSSDTLIKGDFYIKGSEVNLNTKELKIEGSLTHSDGELNVAKGSLIVGGAYRVQTPTTIPNQYTYSRGALLMQNPTDKVLVSGDFVIDTNNYSSSESYLSAGVLEVKGDFRQLSSYSNYSFKATGAHKVILSGSEQQIVHFEDPSYRNSHFSELQILNSSLEGVEFETQSVVSSLLYSTETPILNSSNIVLSGFAAIEGDFWKDSLTVNNASSTWVLSRDQVIKGDFNLTGAEVNLNGHTLSVEGNLTQSAGDLYVAEGSLMVGENYRIQTPTNTPNEYTNSYGILIMQSAEDSVVVAGDFFTDSSQYSSSDTLDEGTLEIKGNLSVLRRYNLVPSGDFKVILSGDDQQTVFFTDYSYSYFSELELNNTVETLFSSNVQVTSLFNHNQNPFVLQGDENVFVDYDGDQVLDNEDYFPLDASESADTDLDGIGDNSDPDTDVDGDGLSNFIEIANGLDPLNPNDANDDFDNDGLTNAEEIALGTNLNAADSDGDGVNDNIEIANGSDPLDSNSIIGPLGVLSLFNDTNADGVLDWISYKEDEQHTIVKLYSGDNFDLLNEFTITYPFNSVFFYTLQDRDFDDVEELGVFGFDSSKNRYQLLVHSGSNGAKLGAWNWPATLSDVSFEVLSDLTGDGVEEYAISGVHLSNGTRQLVVKDGMTRGNYQTFKWPNQWDSPKYVVMTDITSDGIPEVAMHGKHERLDKGQLFMYDGANANSKLDVYNWNPLWDDISLHQMDDLDGDGTTDWGQFGKRTDDGRYQWLVKKGNDKRGVIRTFSWPNDLINVKPLLVSDRTNDGIRDVAIVGTHPTTDKVFLRINDGRLANQRITNFSWPGNWEDTQVVELSDLNNDGFNEFALLGYTKTNRSVQVVVKDGRLTTEYGRYTLPGKWEGISLLHYDTNNDGVEDIVISGISQTQQALVLTSLDGKDLTLLGSQIIN